MHGIWYALQPARTNEAVSRPSCGVRLRLDEVRSGRPIDTGHGTAHCGATADLQIHLTVECRSGHMGLYVNSRACGASLQYTDPHTHGLIGQDRIGGIPNHRLIGKSQGRLGPQNMGREK